MKEKELNEKLKTYLKKIKEKDDLFEYKLEFGKFLMRPIESLSEDELKRYNELKRALGFEED